MTAQHASEEWDFTGADDIGLLEPRPEQPGPAGILQRIRDGLLALPADSSDDKEAAA